MKGRQSISIERLVVWAYRDQRVDRDGGGLGAGQSSAGAMFDYLSLGCRIDTSPVGARMAGSASMVHPDAVLVDRLVASSGAAEVLMLHGRIGARPEWYPGAVHRFVPERRDGYSDDAEIEHLRERDAMVTYWPRGVFMPRVLQERIEDSRQWQAKGDPLSRYVVVCAVRETDSPDVVRAARERYATWCAGLNAVLAAVREKGVAFKSFSVTDELPQEQPWLDDAAVRREMLLRMEAV